jgi:phosphonate transport system substrate-binding protein
LRALFLRPTPAGFILHAPAPERASPVRSPSRAMAQAVRLRRRPTFGFAALIACLLLALPCRAAAGAAAPLVLGVFPSLTPRQIVETYRPLVEALETQLQRRIVVYSARDFKTFVERTRKGRYDLVLTAPHLAWLARQEAGYRPLLKYARPVRGLLVVKAGSPYRQPGALRGRTLATADSVAVAVLAVEAELDAHGLRRNVDYRTVDAGTHLNAVMQVVKDRADGAMLGLHPYRLLPPELRRQVRVLAETPPLSSLMYLAHPRLGDAETHAVSRALLDFAAGPAGQAFMQRGGLGGFAGVDGSELRAFRPYALQAQEMLREAR